MNKCISLSLMSVITKSSEALPEGESGSQLWVSHQELRTPGKRDSELTVADGDRTLRCVQKAHGTDRDCSLSFDLSL